MIFVILFIFCARFVHPSELPSILPGNDRASADGNGTIDLECIVQNLGSYSLTWSKKGSNNNEIFIGVDQSSFFMKHKYALSRPTERKFVLNIKDVNVNDNGTYKCSVTIDSNNVISKDILLTVRTPPTIIENTTSFLTVRANSSTKFECYVSGNPPPRVIWTREDGGLLPNGNAMSEGNILRIMQARKEHAGTYFCTGNNEVNSVKKTYKLQVEFEPEIEVQKKRVGQALQHKAELECKISAHPDPTITWYRAGNQITNYEPNYKVVTSTLSNAVTVSKLVITAVNRTQYGNYTCKASNNLLMKGAQQSIEFYETPEEQCYPPCTDGSSFEYPDLRLIFSTTCMLVFLFRW